MFCHSELYILQIFITNYIILKRNKKEHFKKLCYLDVKMPLMYISITWGNNYLFCIPALHFYSKF